MGVLMTMSDSLRDRIARLLYAQNPIPDDAADDVMTWDEIGENYRGCFYKNADDVIAAIREHHAIVRMPEPDSTSYADEDCNGARQWLYPHGCVTVFDDGTVEWGRWHGIRPQKLRDAAAALLAAADAAEREQ